MIVLFLRALTPPHIRLILTRTLTLSQLMEEGQRLAAKQADLEGAVKRLRAEKRELEAEKDK